MERDAITELPHTADIGFSLAASSLERLFGLAAEALARTIGAEADGREIERQRFEAVRPDLERLLVAWLRELLGRSEARRQVPRVRSLSVVPPARRDAARLVAIVAWFPWSGDPLREIKGVTYHDLHVRREGGTWQASVVLDI
ncbi:MAG: archease [Gemmatimonadota bacterium]